LGSVIRLKHKELDLMKIDVRDIGRDLKELQEIIDLLDRVLMGVPYANMNNFIGLYAEVLLYAQVIEGGFGDQIYSKCRKMLLNLLNVPNVTIRTTLLESLLVNLLTDSQVIYRREGFPKKSLAFQSLLDREIVTEILFAGLESEQTINSVAKIFSSFLNIAMADNLNPARIQHFTNISTMIHCLTSESDPEATGTGPTASKGKYECLRPISEAIYKALPEALLKSLLTDLFSKDRKRRVLALKFLADPLFLKRFMVEAASKISWFLSTVKLIISLEQAREKMILLKIEERRIPWKGFWMLALNSLFIRMLQIHLKGIMGIIFLILS